MGKYIRIAAPIGRHQQMIDSIMAVLPDPEHSGRYIRSNLYLDRPFIRIKLRVDQDSLGTQTRCTSDALYMARQDRAWSSRNGYPMLCITLDEWLDNPDPAYWEAQI